MYLQVYEIEDKINNVQETIEQYIHYYNYIRPAWTLNYKTPIQYKIELGFEHFL